MWNLGESFNNKSCSKSFIPPPEIFSGFYNLPRFFSRAKNPNRHLRKSENRIPRAHSAAALPFSFLWLAERAAMCVAECTHMLKAMVRAPDSSPPRPSHRLGRAVRSTAPPPSSSCRSLPRQAQPSPSFDR
jgi:hypothetical protein